MFEAEDLRVYASPVEHLIPTIGLRFVFGPDNARAVTYSCDTRPSQVVRRLAEGAQALIHESTGDSVGHTPAEKAGEIASQAGAGSLYLIHYPPQLVQAEELLERARTTFAGPVFVAKDFMEIKM